MKLDASHVGLTCSIKGLTPFCGFPFFTIVAICGEGDSVIVMNNSQSQWKVKSGNIKNIS